MPHGQRSRKNFSTWFRGKTGKISWVLVTQNLTSNFAITHRFRLFLHWATLVRAELFDCCRLRRQFFSFMIVIVRKLSLSCKGLLLSLSSVNLEFRLPVWPFVSIVYYFNCESKGTSLCFPELFCWPFCKFRALYLCLLAWLQMDLVSEYEIVDTVEYTSMYVYSWLIKKFVCFRSFSTKPVFQFAEVHSGQK